MPKKIQWLDKDYCNPLPARFVCPSQTCWLGLNWDTPQVTMQSALLFHVRNSVSATRCNCQSHFSHQQIGVKDQDGKCLWAIPVDQGGQNRDGVSENSQGLRHLLQIKIASDWDFGHRADVLVLLRHSGHRATPFFVLFFLSFFGSCLVKLAPSECVLYKAFCGPLSSCRFSCVFAPRLHRIPPLRK